MEQLSQNELIGLVTLIRDKKEYQQTIFNCKLLNELHQIVHHEQSSNNKYNGIWTDELKNAVIHQILFRIIPKDERDSFTKDHPLLSKIAELSEANERGSDISFQFISQMNEWCSEIRRLKKHIQMIETTEIKEYIELIQHLESIHQHNTLHILNPLIKLGWIDENMNVGGTSKRPDISGNGNRKTIYSRVTHFGGGLDMVLPHRLYFNQLCDNYTDEYYMNDKYVDKIHKLMKEINTLKQENTQIRKDDVEKIKVLFDKLN
tara:strand:+ start:43 stop:828 length:786 start_codon:yes stop_codon:yes gene_type:complete